MFKNKTPPFIILLTVVVLFIDLPKLPYNSFQIYIPQINLPFHKKIPEIKIKPNEYSNMFPLKLGLDLQGGTQLVLQTDMEKIPSEDRDSALESARQVIERRVNLFGVSETIVQLSKIGDNRRILVDLPGVKDASAAAQLVGKTAKLDFREEPLSYPAEATASGLPAVYFFTPTDITGADLKKSEVVFNGSRNQSASPQVSIEFTPEGAKKFAEVTKRNVGKPLAIFLDEQPLSYRPPIVQEEILGGRAVISGDFTIEEAKQLSIQLNAGALPVPIKIIEQHTIAATLGKDSVNKSIVAGMIGLSTVIFYMIFYYGLLGVVADLALIIYALMVLAIFKTGSVTLTLAGIAGFVLSIGMAVDANILIFERMKEEKRWGKDAKNALELGFKRAWSSIRDSNVSSLITASILYFLGTGPVRGFAISLAIGVLVSMFTAIIVTRTILRLIIKYHEI